MTTHTHREASMTRTHTPGTIWKLPTGRIVIIRDDGRALDYPSMRLLLLWPDLSGASPVPLNMAAEPETP
jgi:hypothetical protein